MATIDVQSRKRAGRRVRQRLRKEAWAAARRYWVRLTVLAAGWLAATVLVVLVARPSSTVHAAFWAGLMIGLLPMFVLYFLIGTGISHRQMGADAEEWTAEELAKLPERTWRVVHDVPMEYGNIDHVAIGPGRVYAIETKWSATPGKYLNGACGQAERNAKRLRALLAERGAGREVIPLLIVWGPGGGEAMGDKPRMHGRTRVMAGPHSAVWLERMTTAANRLEFDLPAFQAVEQIVMHGERDAVAQRG